MQNKELEEVIAGLSEQQFTITSTIPLGKLNMPLPQLSQNGVFVMTGTDSVIDHWSPFGTGSMLEKSQPLYAQLYGNSDNSASRVYFAIATGNVLPLGDAGKRQWPAVNDNAEA